MKKLKLNVMLVGITAFMMTANSCKKEADVKDIAQTNIDNQNDDATRHCHNHCTAIHTEDDGLGIIQDIYYNGHKNPDSLQEGNETVIATYDCLGRLAKIKYRFYDLQDYEIYYYHGNSPLPYLMKYIVPNFTYYGMTDSLNAIDSLWYNCKGELTKNEIINIWYPGYDYADLFTYNNHDNITNIQHTPVNGSTFAPFSVFSATLYDNKDNFLGGNKWVKYLEMFIGFEPYTYMLYSKNNASTWSWTFDPASPADAATGSTFTYNQYGFATQIVMRLYDGTSNFDVTRTNVSTCDNNSPHRQSLPAGSAHEFPLFKNNLRKLNNQQSFPHPITNNHSIRN